MLEDAADGAVEQGLGNEPFLDAPGHVAHVARFVGDADVEPAFRARAPASC